MTNIELGWLIGIITLIVTPIIVVPLAYWLSRFDPGVIAHREYGEWIRSPEFQRRLKATLEEEEDPKNLFKNTGFKSMDDN